MSAETQSRYLLEMAQTRELRPALIEKLLEHPALALHSDRVSSFDFKVFSETVFDLTAHGIAVFIVQPPAMGTWWYGATFVAQVRLRCGDRVPIIDYGDVAAHEDLFMPPSIRLDGSHMNFDGSLIWSKDLADDMSELIGSGALARPMDCLAEPIPNRP